MISAHGCLGFKSSGDSKSLATDGVLPAVCNTALSNRLLIREAFDRKRIRGTNLVAKAVEAAEKGDLRIFTD